MYITALTVLATVLLSYSLHPYTTIYIDPIEELILQASNSFEQVSARETFTLEDARQAYRRRRQKDPPPGFDEWFHRAKASEALIIEEFWDPIYQDLQAFSRMNASVLRLIVEKAAHSKSPLVNGFLINPEREVLSTCQEDNPTCHELQRMIQSVSNSVPGKMALYVATNGNSSPRVILPYGKTAADGLSQDKEARRTLNEHDLFKLPNDDWWTVWLKACPSDSPMTKTYGNRGGLSPFSQIGNKLEPTSMYVSDTASQHGICEHPELATKHGVLVRPLALYISQEILPIFAPAYVSGIETAIRYPDTIYWAQDPDYHAGVLQSVPWHQKANKAFWRGSNTGGAHDSSEWQYFHRHRFVALTNASYLHTVRLGEQHDWAGTPEALVSDRVIRLAREHMDTGFSAITCRHDGFRSANLPCDYLDAHFRPAPWTSLNNMLSSWRYLYDIDGNSFSGRFHALLLSNSTVFKATVYKEWHDARLWPWLHFVPISSEFGIDVWDNLDFFLSHEKQASDIANAAREWALRVLRQEDMELYLLRLLLEWSQLLGAKG